MYERSVALSFSVIVGVGGGHGAYTTRGGPWPDWCGMDSSPKVGMFMDIPRLAFAGKRGRVAFAMDIAQGIGKNGRAAVSGQVA